MLHLILKSYTDEGFGRNVYKHVFFLRTYIHTYIYIYIYINSEKHIFANVSAKAFISITFPNKMEHPYRL